MVKSSLELSPDLEKLANALFEAERTRVPIEPLTSASAELDLDSAYRIQRFNVERRLQGGDALVGHKIGLTSKPMQEKFGVDIPDYGHLLRSMHLDAGEVLDMGELIDPQIEVEPAFVLGRDLAGPGLTIEDVMAATDYITTCFEIIDSRIIDWQIRLPDTVADNGSSSRFILGAERHRPSHEALQDLETVLDLDGQVVETGNTNAILGHPANGIVWLGNTLAEYGIVLEAGHIVLPGTCIRCHRIGGHSTARAGIERLGEIELKLTGAPSVQRNSD
jgi:2-keto-4-pentenoate hydratase